LINRYLSLSTQKNKQKSKKVDTPRYIREKMVKEAKTKINQVGSRHTIYLQKSLVEDSNFPFKPGEPLIIRIEGDRLIVERGT